MSTVAKDNGGTFEQLPAGLYSAVCYAVWDLGIQTDQFGTKPKIMIGWEVDHRIENPDSKFDGKRFVITKEYNLSLNNESNLTKDLISWRGKEFTEEELQEGFDVKKIIGCSCKLNILHKTSKSSGKTYAMVSAVMKMPSTDAPLDAEIDGTPPDWVIKKIESGQRIEGNDDDATSFNLP